MTIRGTLASGSFKQPTSGKVARVVVPPPAKALPKVLSYPKLHSLDSTIPHLKDHTCYVIKHYGHEGISVVIVRQPKQDSVAVLCGDWYGNNLDLDGDSTDRLVQAALVFVNEDLPLFINTMKTINITQAEFFFALDSENRLMLVDIQISLNKLTGPGMVRDLFGNVYRTQEVVKVENLDDRAVEYIGKGTGNYEGDLIIKPSKFTTFSPTAEDAIVPLYAEVRR